MDRRTPNSERYLPLPTHSCSRWRFIHNARVGSCHLFFAHSGLPYRRPFSHYGGRREGGREEARLTTFATSTCLSSLSQTIPSPVCWCPARAPAPYLSTARCAACAAVAVADAFLFQRGDSNSGMHLMTLDSSARPRADGRFGGLHTSPALEQQAGFSILADAHTALHLPHCLIATAQPSTAFIFSWWATSLICSRQRHNYVL